MIIIIIIITGGWLL